jgi:hypothetical protein
LESRCKLRKLSRRINSRGACIAVAPLFVYSSNGQDNISFIGKGYIVGWIKNDIDSCIGGRKLLVALSYTAFWIIASLKLADRNWKLYYPTLLYAALGNGLYELLCYNYPLWKMEPNGLVFSMIPILLLTLIGMPLSTWVYLSHYPSGKRLHSQALYIGLYCVVFIILEYIAVKFGSITYHNGWNLLWSLLFVIVMFVMLRLHFLRSLIAIMISVAFAFSLCLVFDVNFDK